MEGQLFIGENKDGACTCTAYYIQTQNQIIRDVHNKIAKILPMGQQRNDAKYREKETY